MNPLLIATLVLAAACSFARGLSLRVGTLRGVTAPAEARFDRPVERFRLVLAAVVGHEKLRQYPLSGFAHALVFFGFLVLALRSAVLVGRGIDPAFNAWLFEPGSDLGAGYGRIKDLFEVLTILGASIFGYLRLIRRSPRLTLNRDGLLILVAIVTMLVADFCYDGSCLAILLTNGAGADELLAPFGLRRDATPVLVAHPIGAFLANWLVRLEVGEAALRGIALTGYYVHILLLCGFLAYIPRSKHLHILTAPFSIYTSRLGPKAKLPSMANGVESFMELVESAASLPDELDAPIGLAKLEHLTWKDRLDLLSCTECGRCEDHCPATRSGLDLSPKAVTLALRGALYGTKRPTSDATCATEWLRGPRSPTKCGDEAPGSAGLVPRVVSLGAVWACTTCGACEQECPVGITVAEKVVRMRRHLVTIRGDIPDGLGRPFEALATNYNPWNVSPYDRLRWAAGVDVPLLSDTPDAEVLLWVGCAPAYDARAQRIARSVARLLNEAQVRFAVLGAEERCTGDVARRCGNELLFLELAEANIATLERYREKHGFRRIVTLCPHCHNTLQNEYPALGGSYVVTPHASYLLELVESGRLVPQGRSTGRVTFHDPCYLTRHSGLGAAPRQLLRRLPGVELFEVPGASGSRAECCGGGGAQTWLDSHGTGRTNERRARQLASTGSATVVTACPFCLGMLSDGMASIGDCVPDVRDLAELLAESCCVRVGTPAT